ncbi:hypothetical protein Bca52824_014421 [Brassica carinata]|uniref:Uncharacterized protein n=1 Tax=Brassica carinata TaxID=52824 RepID=A0A8X7W2T1_BRACI|nr:hypothetical protein Bca52824_014421 [Brassica carinata]
MWGFVRRWRTRTTSQTQMLLALLTLKPAVAISKYGLSSLFLNLSYTNFSRELYLLWKFALGPSAWDEIHHAILKASKIELKGGLLEQFTHEMEPFLRKQVQPDVDHVTVRWIPANNSFAITVSVIDQDLAQKNVYQNQGVSFPDA